VRLTLAFCRFGFDDESWYADSDLDLLLTTGDVEMHSLSMNINEIKTSMSKKNLELAEESSSTAKITKAISELERQLRNQEAKQKDIEGKLTPLIKEKERRRK
jgi:septal ring factor EnvC (AmiA/AmiB activator)